MKGSNLCKTQWLLIILRICRRPALFSWPFAQSRGWSACWLPRRSCVIMKTGCQSTSSSETSATLFLHKSEKKESAPIFLTCRAHMSECWLGSLSPRRASDICAGSRWLSLSSWPPRPACSAVAAARPGSEPSIMSKEEVVRLGPGLSVGSQFNVKTETSEPDAEKKKWKRMNSNKFSHCVTLRGKWNTF